MKKIFLLLAAVAARLFPPGMKRWIYQFKPLASWIRRSLNRAAPRGLTVVKVAAGELAGARLLLDMQTEKDFWLGTYEPELQSSLKDLVRPGMHIYDVGANIGYISLILAKKAGENGHVTAFEALPENQQRLSKNLELNQMDRLVDLVPAAVVDAAKTVQFLVAPSGGMGKVAGSAGRENVNYLGVVDIPGISLDEYVYEQGHRAPDLVKMDIEGGEVLALPGMRRLLAQARPVLLLELHGPESVASAWQSLTAAQYRICRLSSGYPQVCDLDHLDWKAYLVAFPDHPDAAAH